MQHNNTEAYGKTYKLHSTGASVHPLRFNTRDNDSYIGAYTDPDSVCERATFMVWYDTVREEIFDFRVEMHGVLGGTLQFHIIQVFSKVTCIDTILILVW